MYKHYKIVCNTAAGRRRYMQYLLPPILSCDIIDRYDIWVNTVNMCDIEFFKQVAAKYPKVNLIWQPDGVVDGNKSINVFYEQCVDEETIYIKMDDDIVWIEPGFFEAMVEFRINNPEYFIVSPLVINNALCTYILSVKGKLKIRKYLNARANHAILWRSEKFAVEIHKWFLNTQLPNDAYKKLHCGKLPISINRFSINSIIWFGAQMKKFGGVVPGDDEEFLSSIKPTQLGLSNCFNGDIIVSHFAFYTQREALDSAHILEQYGNYLHTQWAKEPAIAKIDLCIQEILSNIKTNAHEILSSPSPYQVVPVSTKSRIMKRYKWAIKMYRRMVTSIEYKRYILD